MKKLSRLFTAAFILFAAAACGTKEIDHPDNPDNPHIPDTPQDSEFTITASIVKTRVSYYDIDADLDQKWDVGDVLFGYYDRSVEHKVILYVSDVDKEGNATLTPVSGDGFATLNDLAGLGPSVPVDVVYTGANVTSSNYPFDDSGNLTVDMHSQNGVRIPACMHARASVDTDKKTLSFEFINDCAILEIYSLTGLKDDDINLSNDVALTSLSVTNLYLEGKYTLGKDGFEFGPTNIKDPEEAPDVANYQASFLPTDGWEVTPDASIKKNGTLSRYLIAVVPNTDLEPITVSATADGVQKLFGHTYGNYALEADKCYVIHEADVVAKTVDGLYFKTVSDAFSHADVLFTEKKYDGEHNIVTLVKDCGIAGINAQDESQIGGAASIDIDGYNVTFDLNGHTLTIGGDNECFNIAEGDALLITDSKGKDSQGNYHGMIQSDPDGYLNNHIIYNRGTLYVNGGILWHSADWNVVRNYSTGNVVINDGELCSEKWDVVTNGGKTVVYGGHIHTSADGEYTAIFNSATSENGDRDGELEIYGGILYSKYYHAIESQGKSVVIGDSTHKINERSDISISSDAYSDYDLDAVSAIHCSQGTFDMYYGNVIGKQEALSLVGNVTGNIYGGYLESSGIGTLYIHDGPECTISGGTIYNKNTDDYSFPAVYFFSDTDDGTTLEVKWPENTGNDGNGYIINVEGNHEPLLYSSGSNKYCSPIRKSRSNLMTDYSTLSILGGYLVSNNNAFYAQDKDTTKPSDPMDNNYFDGFYSNASAFHYDADKSAPLDTPGHKLYSEYNASAAGDGFNIDTITSSPPSGKMYKITGPAQTGSTAPYIFNDFEW